MRVSVVGVSGSGKTSLASRLAEALDVEHIELDSIYWLPGWSQLPNDDFRRHVTHLLTADGWVVDGNSGAVRDLIWSVADTVVWFDLPRVQVVGRVFRRTVRRLVTRQRLWNGNRERPSALLHRSPRRNLVLWAWTKHAEYSRRYADAAADPSNKHLDFVRIATSLDAERLIDEVRRGQMEQPGRPPR